MSVDQKQVGDDWGRRGFTCDLWIDQPGQVWKDFVHTKDELLMIVEGELELDLLGKTVKPRPGEEILIPAGTSHTVRNVGKTSARWLYGYKE